MERDHENECSSPDPVKPKEPPGGLSSYREFNTRYNPDVDEVDGEIVACELYGKLPNLQRSRFVAAAMTYLAVYNEIRALRIRYKKHSPPRTKIVHVEPYAAEVERLLSISHPRYWTECMGDNGERCSRKKSCKSVSGN